MSVISSLVKSYIAGFLDGDGCIRRKDYIYGFQIRASIVFYQNEKNRHHLEWLHSIFTVGYIRLRRDHMAEYTIVGFKSAMRILKLLKPYLRLKKPHVVLAGQIHRLMSGQFRLKKFIQAAELVDGFAKLNYSKKRINTSQVLKDYLRQHKLYPCND